ncbi:MAG: BaiN/RdsA family NAD(P)/FAD-dependent oxidoreductase [Anaerolineae bacterium]
MGADLPVIVIGAGASGLMAAGRAAEQGAPVLLIEKTERPGKKMLISGKTRCNLTNVKPVNEFVAMFGANGRFLHGAFSRFFRDDLLALLRRYGVDTKVEQGGRVFPASDDAGDVVAALRRYATEHGVALHEHTRAVAIEPAADGAIAVRTDAGSVAASAVVLASGGASWPGTGSSGDGYRMAQALGHTIVPLRPALVPLVVEEIDLAKSMQGVALRNVRLTAYSLPRSEMATAVAPSGDVGGRGLGRRKARPPVIESRLGEMMFTHFGIGGPVTLLMSLAIVDALAAGPVMVALDLKPGLDERQLRLRLQRDLETHGKRSLPHLAEGLLPRKLIDPIVGLSGIPADKPAHQITAEERERLLRLLKALPFSIKGPLPMARAIVTAGGISLPEVDPTTMASRLVPGLYFCGEVLDLDADTGGYNLQAAFSTGHVAGENAALRALRGSAS